MMYIMAPFQAPVTTILLPSPQPEDRQGNVMRMTARRSMNNTLYTYVQDTGRVQLVYKMRLFRAKALELRAFCSAYLMRDLRLVDYNARQYKMVLVSDPFEFTPIAREEITEVLLTFEGALI